MFRKVLFLIFVCSLMKSAGAQQVLKGLVKDEWTGEGISYADLSVEGGQSVSCDSSGRFSLSLSEGVYRFRLKAVGYVDKTLSWQISKNPALLVFTLEPLTRELSAVTVKGIQRPWDVRSLTETVGTTIYAGKKNEIIDLNALPANTATNNARQLYAKVPGINIIENDDAGIQLSIATRGLNPNRTTEFNSRQNGYDISADPIGYPENYYTPPTDALDAIEIIRGAASLQYGTQFGGLLNFKFKRGKEEQPFGLVTKQTVGSYGFFNSFNSLGGQRGKLNYYGFYNYKRGDGWRQNNGFDIHNAFVSLKYILSPKVTLGIDYTFMEYQMQQPGGLTDKQFAEDPRQSTRNRNWFAATWNIPAVTLDYAIDSSNLLSVKAYALLADRKNVGNLNPIIYADNPALARTVMNDDYRNYYVETRYIHHYQLIPGIRSSFLAGLRLYHGDTHRIQGYNETGSDANYTDRDPANRQIDYRFPSYNAALFAENVFQLTDKFSVTPGIRLEYIQTNAKGYTIADTTTNSHILGDESHTRKFPLLGIGLDYKVNGKTDAYANFSQNYSPVNFGDIVILQPGMRVDPNLKDVKGYNADIGYRGQFGDIVSFDLSGFLMLYKNRIGVLLQSDGGGDIYQYRTNISNSRSLGAEIYTEVNLWRLLRPAYDASNKLSVFASFAYTDARYIDTPPDRRQFEDKKVEYAAPWIDRFGLDFLFNRVSGSLQYSYTDAQFSDATNALSSTDGSVGLIPSYHTLDFTIGYSLKRWKLSVSVNNLTNEMYFTRRTTGFPGPGIIPSQGRAFYSTLQFSL